MDTIKMNHTGSVRMIAHRGVCGLEKENTAAAFVAAGNRSYFGIETDIHETADGKFIIIHDDNTKRVAGCEYIVEQTDFDTLRSIKLFDRKSEQIRGDLVMPTLEEYISICRRYEKVAVLELKNAMKAQTIQTIIERIRELEYLDKMIFISFSLENLITVRQILPDAKIQYIIENPVDMPELLETLKKYRLDIDMKHTLIKEEMVPLFHENGIQVNVWTVNTAERAERLQQIGVDYITTNIVE